MLQQSEISLFNWHSALLLQTKQQSALTRVGSCLRKGLCACRCQISIGGAVPEELAREGAHSSHLRQTTNNLEETVTHIQRIMRPGFRNERWM